MKTTILSLLICFAALLVAPTGAMKVVHDPDATQSDPGPLDPTTLRDENFEDCTVGFFPDNGNWTLTHPDWGGYPAIVVDNMGNGSHNPARVPGPWEGNRYVEQYTQWDPGSLRYQGFQIDLPYAVSSGMVHVEWMMYLATDGTMRNQLTLGFAEGWMSDPYGEANLSYYHHGIWTYITDWIGGQVPIVRGQWQRWEYDYYFASMNKDDRYWITVDGVTHVGPCDPWINTDAGESPFGRSEASSFYLQTEISTYAAEAGFWIDSTSGPGPDQYELTVQVDPCDPCALANSVTPAPGVYMYDSGAVVPLNADRYLNCPAVYEFDHWDGAVVSPGSSSTTVNMTEDRVVTAVYADGRKCNDECRPYPVGDFTEDCYVALDDFSLLASEWMDCVDPGPPCNAP